MSLRMYVVWWSLTPRAVREVVDLDAEQVLHRALVDDIPRNGEAVHEGVVSAAVWTAAVVVEASRVHDL